MKKIILIGLTAMLLMSCTDEIHCDDGFQVVKVEAKPDVHITHNQKYRVTIWNEDGSILYLFTDSNYALGTIIK